MKYISTRRGIPLLSFNNFGYLIQELNQELNDVFIARVLNVLYKQFGQIHAEQRRIDTARFFA